MNNNTGEIQSQESRLNIVSKHIYNFKPEDIKRTRKYIQIPTDKSLKDFHLIQPYVDQVNGEIHQSQLTGVVWIYLKKQKKLSLLIQGSGWILGAICLGLFFYQYPIDNVLSFIGL